MPCAWTRGAFVNIDVGVAITFEQAAAGAAAGFWLRSSGSTSIWVTLWQNGYVSVLVERDAGESITELGRLEPKTGFRRDTPTVLRARLIGDVLTVYVDGVPSTSIVCPTDVTGTADLFVKVADASDACILFSDASAKLP
jgi:hypothetical protein